MKLHSLIRGTCRIVQEDYGKHMADAIAQAAQDRYLQLTRENAGESEDLKKHTFKRVYPGIAVYEAMRNAGIESEKAVWYLREYFQRFCKAPASVIRGILKIPGLYKKVPDMLVNISMKGFSEASGFVYRFPEHAENEACFDIVRCPYFETCKRYACTEIVKAFCDSDDASYGNMHPRLIWGRTQTIGHGADCCNFKITRV